MSVILIGGLGGGKGIFRLQGLDALLQGLEDDEEGGNEEDLQEHPEEHPTDSTCSERCIAVGSDTCGEHQWQEPDDHRQ